ncbi:MAG: hypothetical protein ABSH56_31820 [Bryobacteraceae bacterium]|jgi:uncharacterized protein (TIGR03437 family)
MSRLMIAPLSILFLAVGVYAAIVNFTFTVTGASVTTSGTAVSVSGPATLAVSGVGTDTGTFSASGTFANISGGNVTCPFTTALGQGTLTGTMTFPETALVSSGAVSGSAAITGGTGRYAAYTSSTITGSGFTGATLSGGMLSFSVSGTAGGRDFTFTVTKAPVTISGTSVFSGPATLTLAGSSPDTGTFSASGSLNDISGGGNLIVPFTVTLGHGTITGTMTFPDTVLVSAGPVSGSATMTGGTGGYAGYTSSTLAASGTITGSVLSGGTFSFSISGTVTTTGPPPPAISAVTPNDSTSASIQPGAWVSIYGNNLIAGTTPQVWNGDYPATLGGTSVTIDNKPAYLSYAGSTQINIEAPDDTARGQVNVVVTTANGSGSAAVTLADQSPAFSLLGDGKHVAAIIVRPDGSGAYGSGASSYDILGPSGTSLGYRTVAAKAGDIVELYGIGFGPTNPAVPSGQAYAGPPGVATDSITITINGVPVTPSFAGVVSPGLFQFNLTVPAGLGSGDQPLLASVNGMSTQNGVAFALQ